MGNKPGKGNIINRQSIRTLDWGFSSDVSGFAFIEKWQINGFWSALTDFGQKLPVHILQFVNLYGHIKVLEMVQDNNEKGRMKLTLTGIEKYENNGAFGNRIICIRRCSFYDDYKIRSDANERHLNRWADGNTNYDIKELLCFNSFFKNLFGIKNDNSKLVCSSEAESEFNRDGLTFSSWPLEKNPQGLISPFEIMSAKFASDKNGNRYPIFNVENIYV
jgi:hypothetical protein